MRRRLEKIARQIESDVKAAAPVHSLDPRRVASYRGRAPGTLRDALRVEVRIDAKTTSGFSIRVSAPTDRDVLKWVKKGRASQIILAKPSNENGLFFFATATNTAPAQYYGLSSALKPGGLRSVKSGRIAPNDFIKDAVAPILAANRATRRR